MSAQQSGFANTSKKAVHVKWAGKTIALGTFPSAEADEKCARAKALTRAWRSTMRPKPTRDWVMLELERLGVRVVSGRLGRKAGDDDEEAKKNSGGSGVPPPPVARNNSLGWGAGADMDALIQRRNSLGLSMMNDSEFKRRSSLNSLGPALGLDTGIDPTMPQHRPLVGGGAAAAYEAARADHYQQKREEQQHRASRLGLGMGGGMGGNGMTPMGLTVNPNQHYEMLKLHHMNLLNEIQETTLMMNLYQQQQLQQQQQQLQQQQASTDISGGGDQMSMLLQQQQGSSNGNMDFGMNARGGSLSLGTTDTLSQNGGDRLNMPRQSRAISNNSSASAAATSSANAAIQKELLKGQQEQQELEAKLRKLKEDIANRQKEAAELEASSAKAGIKRESTEADEPSNKRPKKEGDEDDTKII